MNPVGRIASILIVLLVGIPSSPALCQVLKDQPSSEQPVLDLISDPSRDSVNLHYVDQPLDTTRTQIPTAALFKSMLIPGWGQIGNKKYIKAAVVISAEVILITKLVYYARKTSDAKKVFDAATDSSTLDPLFKKYRRAKDDRNLCSWLTGVTIFISMFDAYVDAHLAHFPKTKNTLSLKITPVDGTGIGARVSLNFQD
ncbi:MAG: DUF5683 domain-containing protein [candidate division Zixibacteria bacterium]|nr:DUF5683 domain-containing protein [candidate division Zixibacteria bacterium]